VEKSCGIGVKTRESNRSALVNDDPESDVDVRRQVAHQASDNNASRRKSGSIGVKNKENVESASVSYDSASEMTSDVDARHQVTRHVGR
jgi:hypothetical protein